jgi:anti-anti-sigma factor
MDHSRVTRDDESLAINVERARNASIVRAKGVLSRSTADKFEEAVGGAIDEDSPDVILDLGGVRFIDSTGLRSLLRVANLSRGVGGELRLQRSTAAIQRAIEWAGLERRLRWVG